MVSISTFVAVLALSSLTTALSSSTILPRQVQELDPSDLIPEEVTVLDFSQPDLPLEKAKCKIFPDDSNWPSDHQWELLNKTTNGALIKTIPLAAPCFSGPFYDADKCKYVTSQWGNSSLHMSDPTSMMSPLFQGRTCEPPNVSPASNKTCIIGGYPSYALNASRIADIQLGVNFARKTGIRLVVKNTGHDFSGKSGGAGALSIWTHHLKSIEYVPEYQGEGEKGYRGPAFKCGSGVQAWEIYEAASKQGLVVVGGEGKTVGVMGGYILGGGHSPLSSIHGMGADHLVSLSIVLPSGRYVTATATQNHDIYWALAGGGGSTFGVVTSVTVKAHPDFPVTAFSFSFTANSTITFWAGVRTFFNYFIPFSDAGTYSYFNIFPSAVPVFSLKPFFAPNLTIAQTQSLLKPWLDDLAALGIAIVVEPVSYPNYLTAWQATFPQEGAGGDTSVVGSRLFPRSNWLNETLLNATFAAWKESIDAGLFIIAFNFAPTLAAGGYPDNSVNPAWRETVMHSMQLALWPSDANYTEVQKKRNLMTERQKAWIAVSPGAGAYLGESDREDVGFQQNFYGKNYARLLKIKNELDPEDVFWAKTAVGSDAWQVVNDGPVDDENGRLCGKPWDRFKILVDIMIQRITTRRLTDALGIILYPSAEIRETVKVDTGHEARFTKPQRGEVHGKRADWVLKHAASMLEAVSTAQAPCWQVPEIEILVQETGKQDNRNVVAWWTDDLREWKKQSSRATNADEFTDYDSDDVWYSQAKEAIPHYFSDAKMKHLKRHHHPSRRVGPNLDLLHQKPPKQTSGGRMDNGEWETDSEIKGATNLSRRPYIWMEKEPSIMPKASLAETMSSDEGADDQLMCGIRYGRMTPLM
ncbi:hypothetical protein VTL71DRAFT_5830 [Oculimacula yallundae]|uniref:FAD-binding PCMH-type domain-containing protein n=1 Tax=Oculimacula yallundae TaxID=86028 RepID=A0ABR4BYN1_9HELO